MTARGPDKYATVLLYTYILLYTYVSRVFAYTCNKLTSARVAHRTRPDWFLIIIFFFKGTLPKVILVKFHHSWMF